MRKSVDGRASGIMTVLCLVWGLQYIAIKIAMDDIDSMTQMAVRSGVAAALVGGFARLTGDRWLPRIGLRSGAVVGVLFAATFLFVAEGLRRTSASHLTVFLYTAPLFSAIGLHLRLPEERLTAVQWAGMGLAFAGIAITFLSPREVGPGAASGLSGDLLALCAGVVSGMVTVVIRTTRLNDAPATQTLFHQLLGGCVLLGPVAAWADGATFRLTPVSIASLGFQSVVVCFAAFLAWFGLLRHYLANRLGVMLFMAPMFAVLLGVVLLDEQLTPAFIVGAALTLLGAMVVNGLRLPRPVRLKAVVPAE